MIFHVDTRWSAQACVYDWDTEIQPRARYRHSFELVLVPLYEFIYSNKRKDIFPIASFLCSCFFNVISKRMNDFAILGACTCIFFQYYY